MTKKEISALLALAHDSGSRLDLAFPEAACEPLQLPLRESAEERDSLELVGPLAIG